MDDLIGNVLQQLERHGYLNDTIIVVTSDHGWQLGEHGEWAKYSLFESALQVPLIVSLPGQRTGVKFEKRSAFELQSRNTSTSPSGRRISEHVELLDLFPTLTELAGIPIPPKCSASIHNVQLCTEGRSLVSSMLPLGLSNVVEKINATMAKSQCPRPSKWPQANSDQPRLRDIRYMGYSIKDGESGARYTQWLAFNWTGMGTNWSHLVDQELYLDDHETSNVAYEPAWANLVMQLSQKLRRRLSFA